MTEQILEIELCKLLTWTTETNLVFSSTEKKLMVNTSKQMKRFSSFRVGKQLVESLVLTNLDYFNVIFINTLQYKKKCCKIDDVLKLNCFPVKERICMNTVQLVYQGLHYQNFPYQLKLRCKIITRNSRRKQFQENNTEYEKSTIFKKDCPKVFNNLMIFIQKNNFQRSKTNYRLLKQ